MRQFAQNILTLAPSWSKKKKRKKKKGSMEEHLEFCRSLDPTCEEPDGSVAKYDKALSIFKQEGASHSAQLMIDLAFIHNVWVKLFMLEILDANDPSLKYEADEYMQKAIDYVRERKEEWEQTPGAMRWLVHTFARDMFEWAALNASSECCSSA